MKAAFAGTLALILGVTAGAPPQDPKREGAAVLEDSIKALGGEQKLRDIRAASWVSQGVVISKGGQLEFKSRIVVEGLNRYREDMDTADFRGVGYHLTRVLKDDTGWSKMDDQTRTLSPAQVDRFKNGMIRELLLMTLVPLKHGNFKIEKGLDEEAEKRVATVLSVTEQTGKVFKIYFDKEGKLPVKLVETFVGADGADRTRETKFDSYVDFDGIKKATKIEISLDGKIVRKEAISEFRTLEKVPADTFTEPE